MQFSKLIVVALLGTSVLGCKSQMQSHSKHSGIPDTRFLPEPPYSCQDRTPNPPPLPPGTTSFEFIAVSPPPPPWMRTRLETITLPRSQFPALTVAASPGNSIFIAGSSRRDWSINFCARGDGNTDAEARSHMQTASLSREGSLITVNGPKGPGSGSLNLDAPADAPIVIHDSLGQLRVYDMSGPVWVSAMHALTTILNTTGNVDVIGETVDFAGSRGTVMLSASEDIGLKLTDKQFVGSLYALAKRNVDVRLPEGFQTPFHVTVVRKKDFVCRAEFCSKIQQRMDGGWYIFTYSPDGSTQNAQINFQSQGATVVVDTWE